LLLLAPALSTKRDGEGRWGDESGRDPYTYLPATPEAQQWEGWGTALKPATEIVTMARKPLEGTVAANVLQHGTGALNVDGCRVGTGEARPHLELDAKPTVNNAYAGRMGEASLAGGSKAVGTTTQGRWPANLILTYPEDEYKLKDNITPQQLAKLAEWMNENA
jgi:site-specific DNA-methyltransferase (adenine-specific)